MITRLRPILLVLSLLLVSSAAVTAVAVERPSSPPDPDPDPVTRVTRTYVRGPAARFDDDSGTNRVLDPLLITVPEDGTYDAVVVAGFEYHTRGEGRFTATAAVREADQGPTANLVATPRQLALRGSSRPTSTTTRFVVRGLRAGETYAVQPGVVVSRQVSVTVDIRTRRVVLTVDLTPAG